THLAKNLSENLFQVTSIHFIKISQLLRVDIENGGQLPFPIPQRDDNFAFRSRITSDMTQESVHVWNDLGLARLRSGSTDAFSKSDPKTANRPLVRPDHQAAIDHAVESSPKKALHLVVQHAHDGGHKRDLVEFPFTKGSNALFGTGVALGFAGRHRLDAISETES
ncbi:MAG: hypothetical protein QNL77_11745, partial [Akkermansiaceae bacterium]